MSAADLGTRARLEAAFAREERRGLMVAAATRSAAVAVIIGWLAASSPDRGLAFAWVLGIARGAQTRGAIAWFAHHRAWRP